MIVDLVHADLRWSVEIRAASVAVARAASAGQAPVAMIGRSSSSSSAHAPPEIEMWTPRQKDTRRKEKTQKCSTVIHS